MVNRQETYFVKERTSCKKKFTEEDIVRMVDFLVDNIFVEFGGKRGMAGIQVYFPMSPVTGVYASPRIYNDAVRDIFSRTALKIDWITLQVDL